MQKTKQMIVLVLAANVAAAIFWGWKINMPDIYMPAYFVDVSEAISWLSSLIIAGKLEFENRKKLKNGQ